MPRRSAPDPLAQIVGQRIKQLRVEQGVTAEKLAYESDVGSKGFLSDIEHGLALPSLLTLERIAQRLEVSVFDLLVVPGRSDRDNLVELIRRLPNTELPQLLRSLAPVTVAVPPKAPAPLHALRAYATLEVAAGWSSKALPRGELVAESLRLPGRFNRTSDFAVRASGSSMHGFRSTVRDGDWLVMRKERLQPGAAIGKVVLVAREDRYGDKSLHLKRVVQTARRLWFRSDDAGIAPVAVTELDEILATLVSVVSPSALAPGQHTRFPKSRVAAMFGLKKEPTGAWSRVDGHLFFLLGPGELRQKDGFVVKHCVPRPAETAFVLLRDGDWSEYLGIARFDETRGTWQMSEVSSES
jgi:transcriptional regulator with XRE-family HTH domain